MLKEDLVVPAVSDVDENDMAVQPFLRRGTLLSRVIETGSPEPVYIKDGKDLQRVERPSITLISSEGKHVEVRTTEQRFVLRQSLRRLLQQLNDPLLVQVNRNTVVNVAHLQRITPDEVEVATEVVRLSRSYRSHLLRQLEVLTEK